MKAWVEFLKQQEKELGVGVVEKWLASLKIIQFDAANLYLEAKDVFHVTWFEEQIRPKLSTLLLNHNHHPVQVHLLVAHSSSSKEKKKKGAWKPQLNLSADSLDPKCTLDSFLPGEENQVSFALFREALDHGRCIPIYLYAPSGSGKTHLLMGAAHALKEKGLSCFFVRAETFTEHFVAAIRNGAMRRFREMYRHHDVLLIDDVDIFADRTATQEEFFHTFNALHALGRRIILTAQTPPAQLLAIEPRLTSRFEWGIVLPFRRLPSTELAALLEQRIQFLQFPLQPSLKEWMLSLFTLHLKSLTNALDTLLLRSHLEKLSSMEIDIPRAQNYLAHLIVQEKKGLLTPEKVIATVATYYNIQPEDILGSSRTQECSTPRKLAMYLCRSSLKLSFPKIAGLFRRDHSTVMTSVKAVQKKIYEKEMSSALREIHSLLEGR